MGFRWLPGRTLGVTNIVIQTATLAFEMPHPQSLAITLNLATHCDHTTVGYLQSCVSAARSGESVA